MFFTKKETVLILNLPKEDTDTILEKFSDAVSCKLFRKAVKTAHHLLEVVPNPNLQLINRIWRDLLLAERWMFGFELLFYRSSIKMYKDLGKKLKQCFADEVDRLLVEAELEELKDLLELPEINWREFDTYSRSYSFELRNRLKELVLQSAKERTNFDEAFKLFCVHQFDELLAICLSKINSFEELLQLNDFCSRSIVSGFNRQHAQQLVDVGYVVADDLSHMRPFYAIAEKVMSANDERLLLIQRTWELKALQALERMIQEFKVVRLTTYGNGQALGAERFDSLMTLFGLCSRRGLVQIEVLKTILSLEDLTSEDYLQIAELFPATRIDLRDQAMRKARQAIEYSRAQSA